MEFVLLKEVVKSNAEKRALRLSPQLEQHLQECDSCRSCLPEWVEKMAAWEEQPKKSGQ
jgi:hypothetical protein